MNIARILGAAVLVCLARDPAAAPTFTSKPTATTAGGKVKIEFAVDRETDVTVLIEDAAGKPVRHLVAGMLGKNPPAPLKPGSLSQSLDWDLQTDDGKPAAGGPFKVRVRLGLKPELEEYLFNQPGALGGIDCLAADGDGNVYVSSNGGGVYYWNATGLTRVFDRQGRYLRTITPFPSNLPFDKVKGTSAFQADGRIYPVFHDIAEMRFLPGKDIYGHETFVTSDGRLAKLVLGNSGYALRVIGKDGSAPVAALASVSLAPGVRPTQNYMRSWIGPSSDEKSVYFSGVAARQENKHFRLHAVYRAPLDGSAPGQVFLGAPAESGSGEKQFKNPMGVAADKGLIYVADNGNNRIQVFKEADGSFVSSIPCDAPTTIQVHPKSGALYVVSAPGLQMSLVKLSGRENPKELARMTIGKSTEGLYAILALDRTSEPPVLWLGGNRVSTKRIEDKGAAFEAKEMSTPDARCGNAEDLLVDRSRDELYFKSGVASFHRMDIKTGRVESLPFQRGSDAAATQLALSPDGEIFYTWCHISSKGQPGLRKWDRNFKPVNFEALGGNHLNQTNPMNFACRGMTVAPDGNIWLIPPGPTDAYTVCTEMQVYKPDGTRQGSFLWRLSEGATGPRFDAQGNVYLIENIKAHGKALPDWFADKIPPLSPATSRHMARPSSSPTGSTSWMYSSILKFPPTGGAIWYNNHRLYPGKSGWNAPVPPEILALPRVKHTQFHGDQQKMIDVDKYGWGLSECNCQAGRFDVDEFGRSFFPDAGRFRVGVLDTNGNEITFAGSYGNRDCAGKGSLIPDPEIAFAYPYTVAVSRRYMFVGDLLNRRIAKLRLACAAEEVASVR
jgi:NHL repeat-containing protein